MPCEKSVSVLYALPVEKAAAQAGGERLGDTDEYPAQERGCPPSLLSHFFPAAPSVTELIFLQPRYPK